MRIAGCVLVAVVAALAGAAPAPADEVLVLGKDGRVREREDRYLPRSVMPVPRRAPRRAPALAAARAGSVGGELERLRDAGAITHEDFRARRRAYVDARRRAKRLSGTRRTQVQAVLATIASLAARRELTASRIAPLWLTLDRNVRWWAGGERLLGAGQRVEFEGSELVWQHYPGQGLQLQVLGNFGKLNGLWMGRRDDRLATMLDELLPLAAERAGGTGWEYYFAFGGGRAPWVSALAQGTAIQAITRAARRLGRTDELLPVAASSLAVFEARTPAGVRVPSRWGGDHYAMYSFAPRLRIVNGFVQSLVGLHDYARLTGDPRGAALFASGDVRAQREVPTFDTGAWSLYARGSTTRESDLHYHDLLREFLGNLCDRTGTAVYCDTADRFAVYRTEDPRIAVWRSRLKRNRYGRVRFRLSKISTVSLRITRGKRAVEARWFGTVARGKRSFGWRTPRRTGRYRATLTARDLAGNVASHTATVRVVRRKR